MVDSIFMLLIYIALIVLVAYVILWFLGQIGVSLPPQVVKIVWAIVVLVVLYLLWQVLKGSIPLGRVGAIDAIVSLV